MARKSSLLVGGIATAVVILSLTLWWMQSPSPPVGEQTQAPGSEIINATLREFDDQGTLIWEVEVQKGDYRPDRRIADVIGIKGRFYEQGKLVVDAVGTAGTINQAKREITITGKVKGKVIGEEIELSADNLRWNADQDFLQAEGNIRLAKPAEDITIVGELLQGSPSRNVFTLKRKVVATSGKPSVQIASEAVTWDAKNQRIFSQTKLFVTQPQEKRTLRADTGEWDTKRQIVRLKGNVTASDARLDIQLTTEQVEWQLAQQTVALPQSFMVTSPSRKLRVTAQQGTAQFVEQEINLVGEVQAELQTEQAKVRADRVQWQIPSQIVTAEGGIRYERTANNLRVRGDRAVANLAEQSIQVTGRDVISEFTP